MTVYGRVSAALLVLVMLGVAPALSGCDTPVGQEMASLVSEDEASAPSDGSFDAYDEAVAAVKGPVPDAVLMTAGTQGVALEDVPQSWSFTFISPSGKKTWNVDVDHGTAQAPEERMPFDKELDSTTAIDFGSIKVGAAEAVEAARAFGEKSAQVPPNVTVVGVFLELPGAAEMGLGPGVWKISFLEGTNTEGSRSFTVDMLTGAVAETTGQ